jgi:hypothetical protein
MRTLEGKTKLKLVHNSTGELVKVFTKQNNKEHQNLNQQYKDEYDDWHPHY